MAAVATAAAGPTFSARVARRSSFPFRVSAAARGSLARCKGFRERLERKPGLLRL
jgi:hypothetical protein